MFAQVLSDTISKSFQGKDGNEVSYNDTPVLLNIDNDSLFLVLRTGSKYSFSLGDSVSFDPYIPKKQGSILKASNIVLSNNSKVSQDV